MKRKVVSISFAVAATLLFLNAFHLRAAESSGPLTADERAAFLAELQPLQDRFAATTTSIGLESFCGARRSVAWARGSWA